MFRWLILAAWAALLIAPAHSAVPPGPYAISMTLNIKYGPYSDNVLDLCRPKPTASQYKGPYPGMVFIHGGSWRAYNQRSDWDQCKLWASYGYVAATIQYRLVVADKPETWWPAQIIDAQAAFRWLRYFPTNHNLDNRAICVLGDSAGGQLAEYLGYQPNLLSGDIARLYPDSSPHASCIVSEFGPSGFGPSHQMAGAPTTRTMDLIPRAPTWTASTLLVQGTQDTVVSPLNSIRIYDLLKHYHRPVEYLSFIGGHEFKGLAQWQVDNIRRAELAFTNAYAKTRGTRRE